MNGDFEDSIAERLRSAVHYRAVRDVSAAEERQRRGNGGRKRGLGLDTRFLAGAEVLATSEFPPKEYR